VDVLLHKNLGAGFLHRVAAEKTRHKKIVDQTRRKEVVEKTNHRVVAEGSEIRHRRIVVEDLEMSTAVGPKAPHMEVVDLKDRHSSGQLRKQLAVNCMIEKEVGSENTGVVGFVVVGEDYRTCELCRLVDMRWVVLNQNSHPVDCCVKSIQNCLPEKNFDGLQTFPPESPSIHCSEYVVDSAIRNNLVAAADSASYPHQESAPLKLQRSQMSRCWNVHCFADCDLNHLQGIDQPKPPTHPGYSGHYSGYDLSYPPGTDQPKPRVHPDYCVSCPLPALDSVETTSYPCPE
jgi:hypothetical protein